MLTARPHPTARHPALQLQIDFGPAGVKTSSAKLTHFYSPESLTGRQVIGVMNFPPLRVAGFVSEVLVLGAMLPDGPVVLLGPERPVPNGTSIA